MNSFSFGFFDEIEKLAAETNVFLNQKVQKLPSTVFDPNKPGPFGKPEFLRRRAAKARGATSVVTDPSVPISNPQHLSPEDRRQHSAGELSFYEKRSI